MKQYFERVTGNEKWYKPLTDDQGGAQVMEDL